MVKWDVDITSRVPPFFSKLLGSIFQLSLLSCWVGGFASPLIATYYGLVKGNKKLLYSYLSIVIIGELWPKRLSNLRKLDDFFVKHLSSPFKTHTIKLQKLPDQSKPSIMVYHPHGIFSWGFITGGGWRKFYYEIGLTGLVTNSLLHAPFFRLFFVKILGSIEGADKKQMLKKMKKKESFGLIPGGFEEATISCPNKDRVYLKKRKGFVKYALQHGYSLTPVYVFGECNTYSNLQGFWGLRWFMNANKLPAILPFGRWWCPLLPKKVDMATIGGEPLQLPLISQPTKDDVDEWHGKYVVALRAHYDKWEPVYGKYNNKRGLEIW